MMNLQKEDLNMPKAKKSQGGKYLMSSESVTEGHPDKVCDQISDGVLDSILKQDPTGRVACETFITMGLVIVGGEITTSGYVNIPELVRSIVKDIGYTSPKYGFDYETCAILNAINKQSPDIAQGVDRGGAGDQGMMIGYACNETPELMPLPIALAHRLTKRLAEVRKKRILGYLGPDGKSQITVEYENGKPKKVTSVVLASQHTKEILDSTEAKITKKAKQEIIKEVATPVLEGHVDKSTKFFVNETGKFIIGGPQSDTGMTGRKIIVDTYGGTVAHGGGAFSGKDPTKVDRSAAYMARNIAKNIVAAGAAERCLVQLAYVIGVADPVSLLIETFGTSKIAEEKLVKLVRSNFDLTPVGIIRDLKLRRPIFRNTAAYGHFGREEEGFTWEETNKMDVFKKG